MTLAEFYDELAEIAMGWLGWPPDVALAADVNAILVGYKGKVSMLRQCFGGGEAQQGPSTDEKGEPAKLTPKLFKAMFDRPKSRQQPAKEGQ